MSLDWKNWRKGFPHKGLNDPGYIKDRDNLFKKNGNGWWWNDGTGWHPNEESSMERQRRYKREKRRN
jgi:hypothetical protein